MLHTHAHTHTGVFLDMGVCNHFHGMLIMDEIIITIFTPENNSQMEASWNCAIMLYLFSILSGEGQHRGEAGVLLLRAACRQTYRDFMDIFAQLSLLHLYGVKLHLVLHGTHLLTKVISTNYCSLLDAQHAEMWEPYAFATVNHNTLLCAGQQEHLRVSLEKHNSSFIPVSCKLSISV